MNFRYPIFLDLSGKKCLVIGEGHEVAGKVQGLVDAGARVSYINPRAEASIEALGALGLVAWHARDFAPADLDGCFLAITDRDNNGEIFRLAEERGVLCNAVDDPEHCRFSFGSVHRQGDLTIAISTNGAAPAIAVRLREWLAREIGPEYADLLKMLRDVRPEIAARVETFSARRELWYKILDSELLTKLRQGQRGEAERMLRQMLEMGSRVSPKSV
jgi:precorrin-2 dehydrogenase / sirohydrochlorin ferrochelatase